MVNRKRREVKTSSAGWRLGAICICLAQEPVCLICLMMEGRSPIDSDSYAERAKVERFQFVEESEAIN